MYGSKGRLGLLVPSLNTVVERDFSRLLPSEYLTIATRMYFGGGEEQELIAMTREATRGARELISAGIDALAFACTSASFVEGVAGEQNLRADLEGVTGCPIVTTSDALVQALTVVGARTVVVATPYDDDLNQLEQIYLESRGFEVREIKSLYVKEAVDAGYCEDLAAYRLASTLDYNHADAIVISCTNLPTLDGIARLEVEAGRPVITSNQATAWASLRVLGFKGSIRGFGELLERRLCTELSADMRPEPVAG
jgi:maleate isomerase